MHLGDAVRLRESDARALLERLRWPDGPVCPHCDGRESIRFGENSSRPGVLRCRSCRAQYSVTVGTIFHGTRVRLRKWIMAFCLACDSQQGVSALELQRCLDLDSYGTAWSLAHRLRQVEESVAGSGAPAPRPPARQP